MAEKRIKEKLISEMKPDSRLIFRLRRLDSPLLKIGFTEKAMVR